jgi:hypothetical protein
MNIEHAQSICNLYKNLHVNLGAFWIFKSKLNYTFFDFFHLYTQYSILTAFVTGMNNNSSIKTKTDHKT